MKNIFSLILICSALASCAQHTKTKADAQSQATFAVNKSENEWKEILTDEQYYVLRQKGTEKPFTGKLLMNKEKGVYKCAACGNELFTDEMKFDSECGWPSFDKEIAGGKIITQEDRSHGMVRTEIMCANCGGHLGHLFDDGPTETGMRYCVNSLSLEFAPAGDALATSVITETPGIDTLTVGGGCFWCVEAIYENLDGVLSVVSGYSGGKVKNPTYKQVSTGTTGHAEVAQIVYDNSKVSLDEVLEIFFATHDPTTLNRQGADEGPQYRSVIFYRNDAQKQAATSLIAELNREVYDNKIVTEVAPFEKFYIAEDYHQDYFANNKNQPYCQIVIQPKVEKFEKVFKDRLKHQK